MVENRDENASLWQETDETDSVGPSWTYVSFRNRRRQDLWYSAFSATRSTPFRMRRFRRVFFEELIRRYSVSQPLVLVIFNLSSSFPFLVFRLLPQKTQVRFLEQSLTGHGMSFTLQCLTFIHFFFAADS